MMWGAEKKSRLPDKVNNSLGKKKQLTNLINNNKLKAKLTDEAVSIDTGSIDSSLLVVGGKALP